MLIRAGYTISLECPVPTAINVLLNVHPDRVRDLQSADEVQVSPISKLRKTRDRFGNSMVRVLAPAGEITFSNDFVIKDSGLPDTVAPSAPQHPIDDLPPETLDFLLPSRYCDSDALSDLAWQNFNGLTGWACVQSICDFAHETIRFSYADARNTRTASDSLRERVGVCRDYAHLAVALCRAMNIPARYCTGYLGDIGIPPVDFPMDFSAWFEVYLDGRWYTFDARHNTPRIGRIVMARGRDAADVAITHSFGASRLTRFDVVTDEVVDMPATMKVGDNVQSLAARRVAAG